MTTQISDSPAHTTYNLFQQLFHLSQKTSGAQSQQFTKLTVGCAQISSSKWAELGLPHCPEAELSQERGWGCLGCWGCEAKTEHLWSCVVPCGGTYSATSPLSLCGSIPVLWDGTRVLLLGLLHLLLPHTATVWATQPKLPLHDEKATHLL